MVAVFDFDGVIGDTTELKSELFLSLFQGLPEFNLIQNYERLHQPFPRKTKVQSILRDILKKDSNLVDSYLERYASLLAKKLPEAKLVPGVREVLAELQARRTPCHIVSAGVRREIDLYLERHQLCFFKSIYDSSVPKSKALQVIHEESGSEWGQIIYFGDNISDLEAARAVGCRFVAINPNAEFPEDVPVFKDFSALDRSLLR